MFNGEREVNLIDYIYFIWLIFEDGKKPSVAAIQGLALGGGLELTMVCVFKLFLCFFFVKCLMYSMMLLCRAVMLEFAHLRLSLGCQNWALEYFLVLEVGFILGCAIEQMSNCFLILNIKCNIFCDVKGTQRLPRLVGLSKAIEMMLVSWTLRLF